MTPSSPSYANVGTTSTLVLNADVDRKGVVLCNISDNYISIGLNASARIYQGITLLPGAIWSMDEYSFTNDVIEATASAASSTLTIQEFTI